MHDLNRVQLIGHLGQDPEVKYTEQGTARTTLSVATSAHWKAADGQAQAATEWTRCVAWGALAEVCAHSVTKGSRVYVASRLHTHFGRMRTGRCRKPWSGASKQAGGTQASAAASHVHAA